MWHRTTLWALSTGELVCFFSLPPVFCSADSILPGATVLCRGNSCIASAGIIGGCYAGNDCTYSGFCVDDAAYSTSSACPHGCEIDPNTVKWCVSSLNVQMGQIDPEPDRNKHLSRSGILPAAHSPSFIRDYVHLRYFSRSYRHRRNEPRWTNSCTCVEYHLRRSCRRSYRDFWANFRSFIGVD
jgi:hypothetical protein